MELYYHDTDVEEFTKPDAIYKQAVSINNTHQEYYVASEHALIRNYCVTILKNAPFLRSLSIRYGNHTDGFLRRIFSALNKKRTITSLTFRHDYFFEKGDPLDNITDLLKANTTLTNLELFSTSRLNTPDTEHIEKLTKLIEAGSRLKTLTLNVSTCRNILLLGFLHTTYLSFINALANHPNLQSLALNQNSMARFTLHFCALLQNPNLKSLTLILRLDSENITSAVTFLNRMQTNTNIQCLKLNYYDFITDEDEQEKFTNACCQLVHHNTTLQYLSLNLALSFDRYATREALKDAIAANTTLSTLKFRNVQDTVGGLAKAMEGLDENRTLRKFTFTQTSPFEDLSVALRTPFYTTNTTLERLTLSSIPTDKHFSYLSYNTNLTHLSLKAPVVLGHALDYTPKDDVSYIVRQSLVSFKLDTNSFIWGTNEGWLQDINATIAHQNTTLQELVINNSRSISRETTGSLKRNKTLATTLFSMLYPVLEFFANQPAPLKRTNRPSSSVSTKRVRKS
jgi:hypothetical protein